MSNPHDTFPVCDLCGVDPCGTGCECPACDKCGLQGVPLGLIDIRLLCADCLTGEGVDPTAKRVVVAYVRSLRSLRDDYQDGFMVAARIETAQAIVSAIYFDSRLDLSPFRDRLLRYASRIIQSVRSKCAHCLGTGQYLTDVGWLPCPSCC